MRTLKAIALTASLAMVLGVAGQASATPSLDLVYLGGATGGEPCTNGIAGVDCLHTNESDIITFKLVLTVDTLGVTAWGFDIRWDADGEDELDLVNYQQRQNIFFSAPNPTPPPDTIELGNYNPTGPTFIVESAPGSDGHIYGIDATSISITGPFIHNVSFRLGIVSFHVNGNVNKNPGADIETGFFRGDGNAMGDDQFNFITPNFGSFAIDSVPEPGTSLLMGMGVLGLILAGRASRKS